MVLELRQGVRESLYTCGVLRLGCLSLVTQHEITITILAHRVAVSIYRFPSFISAKSRLVKCFPMLFLLRERDCFIRRTRETGHIYAMGTAYDTERKISHLPEQLLMEDLWKTCLSKGKIGNFIL